ncbi:hypothetical protein ACFPK9_15825 [Rubritalea spongiae]|uniref:Uncharacterized protein n=1 Tax=Rubritalea spongiae TaxID=430797 RepID=A0ABW5DYH7_9BACT
MKKRINKLRSLFGKSENQEEAPQEATTPKEITITFDEELNSIFHSFSGLFIGAISNGTDIAAAAMLDRQKLDFSKDSLQVVDQYLLHVFTNRSDYADKELENTILWGGAYTGEVIKRNTDANLFWESYESYMDRNPEYKEKIPHSFTTRTLLSSDNGTAMNMPINKVLRFLSEGEEHSLHYYADNL